MLTKITLIALQALLLTACGGNTAESNSGAGGATIAEAQRLSRTSELTESSTSPGFSAIPREKQKAEASSKPVESANQTAKSNIMNAMNTTAGNAIQNIR